MPKRHDDDDIADVMREEQHRGRRGALDAATQRDNRRLKTGFRELLRSGATDKQIAEALIALGHERGTPEFARLLRCLREYRTSRR